MYIKLQFLITKKTICIKVRYNLTSTFYIDSKTHHFLVKVFMIRLLYLKTESIQTLNIKLNDLVLIKL